MKVLCTNPGTVSLFSPSYMDKPVVFEHGAAIVLEEVGAKMVKEYSTVVAAKAPNQSKRKVTEDV